MRKGTKLIKSNLKDYRTIRYQARKAHCQLPKEKWNNTVWEPDIYSSLIFKVKFDSLVLYQIFFTNIYISRLKKRTIAVL